MVISVGWNVEKTELRKEYKEYDLNHAFDEYSTNINICWKKFVNKKKEMEAERMIAPEWAISKSFEVW